MRTHRHFAFARLLGSAVVSQALLSAASLVIGLVLIRRTSDLQYGYFILASNAILLLASLQNAFFGPALAARLSRLEVAQRSALVGGLYREQRRILWAAGGLVAAGALGLWYANVLDSHNGPLLLATVFAALAILHREYFRMVLFAYRRPHDVLRSDVVHVALLVAGVLIATLTLLPAVAAVFTLGAAALASGLLLSRALRRHQAWRVDGAVGILREIAPLAVWSTAGAAIHWTFSQGYIYLVVGTLDLAAVAAITATRLLLMPVNLLSSGIGSLMLPLTSGWLHRHGAAFLFRRLVWFALGMAVLTLTYFGGLWLARDWIFAVVLKKQFAQRDALLLMWGLLFLVMVARDQLGYALSAQGRFRELTLLTLASALVSLSASYLAMLKFGVVGALAGMLVGELISVAGIVWLATRRSAPPVMATAPGLPERAGA